MGGGRSTAWVAESLRQSPRPIVLVHAGYSMQPCLHPGDRLTVHALDGDAPPSGRIVVARCGPRLVAHRVVSWKSDAVVLRGDANAKDDPSIDASMVIGVVVAAARQGRDVALSRSALRAWLRTWAA